MIRDLPGNIWFPLKARLLVQVDVVEAVTGNKATVEDRTCQFTSSPYRIAFKNTPRYFKPGLRYVVKVRTVIYKVFEMETKPIIG